jgi:hypothetical protein
MWFSPRLMVREQSNGWASGERNRVLGIKREFVIPEATSCLRRVLCRSFGHQQHSRGGSLSNCLELPKRIRIGGRSRASSCTAALRSWPSRWCCDDLSLL